MIIAKLPPIERAIVITMASRGLRVGALPGLELTVERFKALSKGQEIKGRLPPEALDAIKAAGLGTKRPFAWQTRQKTAINANALGRRINNHMGKLYRLGKIAACYSCHDFRHYFARNEYKKDRDIKRVQLLLGHKNIAITDAYLRSIDAEIEE
jgi:integrase